MEPDGTGRKQQQQQQQQQQQRRFIIIPARSHNNPYRMQHGRMDGRRGMRNLIKNGRFGEWATPLEQTIATRLRRYRRYRRLHLQRATPLAPPLWLQWQKTPLSSHIMSHHNPSLLSSLIQLNRYQITGYRVKKIAPPCAPPSTLELIGVFFSIRFYETDPLRIAPVPIMPWARRNITQTRGTITRKEIMTRLNGNVPTLWLNQSHRHRFSLFLSLSLSLSAFLLHLFRSLKQNMVKNIG